MSKSETDVSHLEVCQLDPSENYIGKPEFLVEGKLVQRTLEISEVLRVAQDWHRKDQKRDLVLAFKDRTKRLILRATNRQAIAAIYGAGVVKDLWVGKSITLFWTLTEPISGQKIRNPSTGEPGGVRVKGK